MMLNIDLLASYNVEKCIEAIKDSINNAEAATFPKTLRSAFSPLKSNTKSVAIVSAFCEESQHLNFMEKLSERDRICAYSGFINIVCHYDIENIGKIKLFNLSLRSKEWLEIIGEAIKSSSFLTSYWKDISHLECMPLALKLWIVREISGAEYETHKYAGSFATSKCVKSFAALLNEFTHTKARLLDVLCKAATETSTLNYLLSNYVDISEPFYREAAFIAVREGKLSSLKIMMEHGLNLRFSADELLSCAVLNINREGVRDILEYLLEQGLEPQSQFGKAMQHAMENGDFETYKRLSIISGDLDGEIIESSAERMIMGTRDEKKTCAFITTWQTVLHNKLELLNVALFRGRYMIAEMLLEMGVNPKDRQHYLLREARNNPEEARWVRSDLGQRILKTYYTYDELISVCGNTIGSFDKGDWILPFGEHKTYQTIDPLILGLLMAIKSSDLIEFIPKTNNTQLLLNLGKFWNCPEKLIELARSNKAKAELAQMMM